MSREVQVSDKHLAVGPPQAPPLAVPAGGGAEQTPYPDFDVVSPDKWAFDWDEKTRRLVGDRVQNVPPYRFFAPEEATLLAAICARLLPQEDRAPEQRVPIAPWIDARLYKGRGAGYRYADMPDDRTAYRRGLAGFDQAAQALFDAPFVALDIARQDQVIRHVSQGEPAGVAWADLPAKRFFQQLVGEVIGIYYAHPAAWAEIGFNGPASPRGHIRLSLGRHDPWEATERQPHSSVAIVRRHAGQGAGPSGEATH